MKLGRVFGWGIVSYAVMALSWTGLSIYGIGGPLTAILLQLLALIVVTTVAGRSLRFHQWQDIFPYALSWAVIAMFLDIVYNVPFFGWGIFTEWNLWLGYALILIVPLLAPKTRAPYNTQI